MMSSGINAHGQIVRAPQATMESARLGMAMKQCGMPKGVRDYVALISDVWIATQYFVLNGVRSLQRYCIEISLLFVCLT